MWFRSMTFTGTENFSIAVEEGQKVYLYAYTTNMRMANFEQDLDINYLKIPCDTANKGQSPLVFVCDNTQMLFFTPDTNNAAELHVMVI